MLASLASRFNMDSKRSSGEQAAVDEEYEFKQQWLRDQMRSRIPEYSNAEKLKIFCGTWNCNDKVFPDAPSSPVETAPAAEDTTIDVVNSSGTKSMKDRTDLKKWLDMSMHLSYLSPRTDSTDNAEDANSANLTDETSEISIKESLDPTVEKEIHNGTDEVESKLESPVDDPQPQDTITPDIYVIGFQEIVDLTPVNVVISNQKIVERSIYWQKLVEEHINTHQEYELIQEKHLVGLLLFVFIKRKFITRIRDVRSVIIPTGVLGIMGNKGAVCVRFDFDLTSICIVCAHFHSGRENLEIRSLDYRVIIEKTLFLPSDQSASTSNKNSKKRESVSRWWFDEWLQQPYNIFDHDIIFWIGDLNYRIDENIPTDELFRNIQNGNWQQYLSKDQLNIERNKRTVFEHFHEGTITFPPTYKYQPGTDIYECRPDKKLRAPAWCDRILYRCKNEMYLESLKLLAYNRVNLMLSDHKPVCGIFDLNIRVSESDKQREVYQSLLRVIDRWENSTTPKVELLQRHLDFGVVQFFVEKTIRLTLKNIGGVFAHWAFVPKLDEKEICKPWLKIMPLNGVLAPGESCEIIAKVLIDERMAKELREGTMDAKLDDIVVLRMTRGSDFFVAIMAEVDLDTVSGLDTHMDNIYDPEATIKYYNEDD